MNIITKDEKFFKSTGTKSQIKSILKDLVDLNKYKTSPEITNIPISQVRLQIIKTFKRYKRMLKIYWTIDTKNKDYKKSSGIEEYSASDVQNMVSKLLENDGYKKVCKRTIERDIQILNKVGLIKSKIRRLGVGNGSISHYIQNMEFAHKHKEIILEFLKERLKENLKNRRIVSDFHQDIEDTMQHWHTNSKKNEKPQTDESQFNLNEHNEQKDNIVMSHVQDPHVINKAKISYIKEKNSKENSEMLLKKADFYEKKKSKCKITRKDVETRLLSDYKISEKYVKQIKEMSNNDSTYINALLNLEQAITDYGIEYSLEDVLEHFLKQFVNRYKHKVWMMMKREDGIINDYEIIWEGRFRDWYPNKYKKRFVEKTVYGENICVGKKFLEKKGKKTKKNLRIYATEKAGKKGTEAKVKRTNLEKKEKRRLELLRREEYLQRLFKQEAKERKERLRRAEEERAHLKNRAKESMLVTLKKNIGDNVQLNETDSFLNKTPPNILSESLSNEDIECKDDCIVSTTENGIPLSETKERVVVFSEAEERQICAKNRSLDIIISDTLKQGITDNTGVNIIDDVSNNFAPDISYRLLPKMDIEFETNYSGFKTSKGLSVSSLGIVVSEEGNKIIKEKET
ncbi:plasmid maintenance protein [Borrelia persica]|uniref:plasmid maintenance protein n=1 Tax=Borrelia persica TaxID=44448 RepID=UPI000466A459|nr:plasmid maintenance protein [Borrelia persica]